MALLTKQQIFAISDVQREVVKVPEWGGDVLVQGLTGRERDAYEATIITQRKGETKVNLINARSKLVALSVIDEQGNRLFDDMDVAQLGAKSAVALERVFDVARRLSGMSDEDMEELTTDLKAGTNGSSGSISL